MGGASGRVERVPLRAIASNQGDGNCDDILDSKPTYGVT